MVRNWGVEEMVYLGRSHVMDFKLNATGVSLYCRGVVVVCDGCGEGPLLDTCNDAVPPGARDLRSSYALDEFLTGTTSIFKDTDNSLSAH
jgi:hypothetical protein